MTLEYIMCFASKSLYPPKRSEGRFFRERTRLVLSSLLSLCSNLILSVWSQIRVPIQGHTSVARCMSAPIILAACPTILICTELLAIVQSSLIVHTVRNIFAETASDFFLNISPLIFTSHQMHLVSQKKVQVSLRDVCLDYDERESAWVYTTLSMGSRSSNSWISKSLMSSLAFTIHSIPSSTLP